MNVKKNLFTSFDNAKIHYEVNSHDNDKAILFVHGLGGDLSAWKEERRFFDHYKISNIAVDLRGHGLSSRSDDKKFYSLENFSKDLLEIMEFEKFRSYVTVGHCFGGMVSILLESYKNPSRGLVLVDTNYRPPKLIGIGNNKFARQIIEIIIDVIPNKKKFKHVNFSKFEGTSDLSVERLFSDILHTSIKSYLMITEKLTNFNAEQILKNINIPTLVIEGSEDTIFPPETALKLNKKITKSEVRFIPEANHVLVINNPEELSLTILNFLKKMNFTKDLSRP